MKDPVYKIIELTGTSTTSVEDAVAKALKRAHKTLKHLSWFQVMETRGNIDKGKVRHWQVTLKVGFAFGKLSATAKRTMKTILASIDFSAASKQVVAEAARLAQAMRARLVLLHVVQPLVVSDSDLGPQMSAEYVAAASVSAGDRLTALQKPLQAKGVTVVTKHLLGNPGQSIIDQATALNADYIVLGSHGHGAFYELIVGSTTSRVLKQARCPVVVVPPKRTGK